jgi:DNA-binding MarR family transcriptional regulator
MASEPPSPRRGAYGLHVLVSRLDRDADRILRTELDLPYPRFLLLLALLRLGPVTQRALADELGVTEPTVSRSVAVLADRGLLTVTATTGQGNRRSVALTEGGRRLVTGSTERLEAAFAGLLDAAGVPAEDVDGLTERLLTVLDRGEPHAPS